ncbi:MAG TPA: hypothetical protein VN665_00785 [Candidatus Paceibacterota bacterium]|nr:hypothetical protein [Candidatus Paceibacterota bacterium]
MLTLFNFVVFFHIIFAILWVGSAVMLELLEWEATHTNKRERLALALHRGEWFAMRVFVPCAIGTLLTGILGVAVGRPTFSQAWVIIALIAVVVVSGIGGGVIGRTTGQLSKLIKDPEVHEDVVEAKLLSIRGWVYLDLAILFFILFDMVMRPANLTIAFSTISIIYFLAVFGVIMFERRSRTASLLKGYN